MTTVYETMRARAGRVPLWDRHRRRFLANCRATGLDVPADLQARVLGACRPGPDYALRIEWNGRRLDVRALDLPPGAPLRVITAREPHTGYRIKTTDRDMFDRARAEARELGADEALLLTPEGYVAEGTLFAIGWFNEDRLCLPSLDLGILPSVGRARVLELATQLGQRVHEGRFRRNALDGRAIFTVTATRGVMGMATLDGVRVPEDDRTQALAVAFFEVTRIADGIGPARRPSAG